MGKVLRQSITIIQVQLQNSIMQKQCKYGLACRNKYQCTYFHPQLSGLVPKHCKFGNNCWDKLNCRYYHPNTEANNEQQKKHSYRSKATKQDFHYSDSLRQQQGSELKILDRQPVDNTEQTSKQQYLQNIHANCSQQNNQNINLNFSQTDRNSLNEIYIGQQRYLQSQLQRFFNVRYMKSKQFDNIYNYVQENVSLEDVPRLMQVLDRLQSQQLNYTPHFGYLKLIKIIVKNQYDFQRTCMKLKKQLEVLQKKINKEQQLLKQFPNRIQPNIIQDAQLLEIHQKYTQHNIIFIVDGDNVLPTHKTFRTYFNSKNPLKKAEGQIRFRWLLSQIGNCILFFDHERVSQQQYEQIQQRIMYKQDIINCHSQNISFANKYNNHEQQQEDIQCTQYQEDQLNQCNEFETNEEETSQQVGTLKQKEQADNLIIKWISDYINKSLQKNSFSDHNNQKQSQNQNEKVGIQIKEDPMKLILVTADRILIHRCLQMTSMMVTSGNFFIKFCKQRIRRKYYGNKIKKSIIKRIFVQA